MKGYFLDSSAIVKRYVNENGSDYVEIIAGLKSGNLVLLSRISHVEIAAAFARRMKGGSLLQTDVENALNIFRHDVSIIILW